MSSTSEEMVGTRGQLGCVGVKISSLTSSFTCRTDRERLILAQNTHKSIKFCCCTSLRFARCVPNCRADLDVNSSQHSRAKSWNEWEKAINSVFNMFICGVHKLTSMSKAQRPTVVPASSTAAALSVVLIRTWAHSLVRESDSAHKVEHASHNVINVRRHESD